jgi:DNA-directed RNA polymerase subunit H (RpoH/RPB5)
VKVLEENIEEILADISIGNDLLDMIPTHPPKAQAAKAKLGKLD